MRSQARYLLPLLALVFALPTTALPERFKAPFEHFLTLCVIGVLGWLMITLVQVIATLIRTRYSITVENNLHARHIHTQTEVLERIFIACIVVITLAAMLVTFPQAPSARGTTKRPEGFAPLERQNVRAAGDRVHRKYDATALPDERRLFFRCF
jgi:hypothetical protein